MKKDQDVSRSDDKELVGDHFYVHSAYGKFLEKGKWGDWSRNDAEVDLHHQGASECDLDYNIARNIVEAFLASGWSPPCGVVPRLRYDHRLSRKSRGK